MSLRHLLWLDDTFDIDRANRLLDRVNVSLLAPTELKIFQATRGFFDKSLSPMEQAHALVAGLHDTHMHLTEKEHVCDLRSLHGLAALVNVSAHNKHIDENNLSEPPMSAEPVRTELRATMHHCPNHPGALHYLIHAYDSLDAVYDADAKAAALALGTRVAPDAPHVNPSSPPKNKK